MTTYNTGLAAASYMSVVTALVAGGVVGVRHALEADHLAAVATLVDDGAAERSALVGASWGIGHSLPIAVLGIVFLLLGVRFPDAVTALFEILVGVVLVGLGVRMFSDVVGVDDGHTHDHDHGGGFHRHLRLGDISVGALRARPHIHGDGFLVGVLHGFAGSGALVVLLVSAAPTLDAALAFLTSFSLLSVATMGAVSALWGRTLGTGLTVYLKVGAALIGVAVGLRLVVESAGALPV